jgi:DNA-binding GntR family transcriptional regulator
MTTNDASTALFTAPSQRTLSDYVADQLRQAILAGQLKPDERLVEQEIAERMQTSRGPVRDAIKALETEGLIARQPHRGAFVSQLRPQDFVEIYTLREALETLATQWAIQNATDSQLDDLASIVDSMKSMSEHDHSQVDATNLDIDFHHAMVRISGHKRVLGAWESMSAQIRLVVLKHRLLHPDDLRVRAVSWHTQIVAALRERNAEKAVHELHVHMAASREWVDALLEAERRNPPAADGSAG